MTRPPSRIVRLAAVGLDMACIAAAFVAATYLRRHHTAIPLLGRIPEIELQHPIDGAPEYLLFVVFNLMLWAVVVAVLGLYRAPQQRSHAALVGRYAEAVAAAALGAGFIVFALKLISISRLFTTYFFALVFGFVVMKQLAFDALLGALRRRGYTQRRVIVVGDADAGPRFAQRLEADRDAGFRVLQVIDSARPTVRNVSTALQTLGIPNTELDDAFVVLSNGALTETQQFLMLLLLIERKSVHIVAPALGPSGSGKEIAERAGFSVLTLAGPGPDELERLGKRLFDVAGALLLAVLLAPVAAAVATLVKLTSSGSVFFAQERLGRGGKPFRLYKFRSMQVDAEQVLHRDAALYARYVASGYKLPDNEDARITGFGRYLRRTGLDELPQLFNVLRGEMSLVGPRPIVPPELKEYGPYASLLLSVKPGITGHWQVTGRNAFNYPVRAELDLEYVLGRSLHVDVGILLRTLPTVINRK